MKFSILFILSSLLIFHLPLANARVKTIVTGPPFTVTQPDGHKFKLIRISRSIYDQEGEQVFYYITANGLDIPVLINKRVKKFLITPKKLFYLIGHDTHCRNSNLVMIKTVTSTEHSHQMVSQYAISPKNP